jgi:hypothetical protein
MLEFITPENIVVILSIVVYAIVFIIQKAQFNKQNEILNKYEKVFAIFNIDEIEKYVELQKKSLILSYGNRELELSNIENKFATTIKELEETLNGSKTNLEESKEISESFKTVFNSSKDFQKELGNTCIKEFEEIYLIIEKSIVKSKNPELYKEIENDLIQTAKKYSAMKNEIINQALS